MFCAVRNNFVTRTATLIHSYIPKSTTPRSISWKADTISISGNAKGAVNLAITFVWITRPSLSNERKKWNNSVVMPSPTALSLTPMEKAKVVLLMSFGSPTGILRQLQDRANYLLLEMQLAHVATASWQPLTRIRVTLCRAMTMTQISVIALALLPLRESVSRNWVEHEHSRGSRRHRLGSISVFEWSTTISGPAQHLTPTSTISPFTPPSITFFRSFNLGAPLERTPTVFVYEFV